MAELFKKRIGDAIIKFNDENSVKHLDISISVGFAVSKNTNDSIERLINKADGLMYEDKLGKRKLISSL